LAREVSLLDLLDAKKVNHCIKTRHKKYIEGKRDFFPWSVELHPTSRCNYDCNYCAYSIRNASNRSISEDALKSLFDVLVINKTKGVFFSGGGEPLMYLRLYDHIIYLNRAGLKVSLLTNGYYLADEKYKEMLASLDYVAISIPTLSQEEFKNMTGRNIPKHLPDLAHIIRANAKKRPIVGARLVANTDNHKSVIETIIKLKSNNYDYCIVKIPKDPEGRGLGLSLEELSYIKEEYSKHSEELSEDFTNLKSVLDSEAIKPAGDICWSIEYGINCFIHTDGGVYLCLSLVGKKEYCIGNIHDENFDDIWKGEKRKEIISLMQSKYKAMECKNCRNIAYNNIIENYPESGFSRHIDPFL